MAIDHLATCAIKRGGRCTCALERTTMKTDPRDVEITILRGKLDRMQTELDEYIAFFEKPLEWEFVSEAGNHYTKQQLEVIVTEWELMNG